MSAPPPVPIPPPPPVSQGFPKGCWIALIVALVLGVLAIPVIGILAGILLPAVSGIRKKAEEAKAGARAYELVSAAQLYFTEYRRFPAEGTEGDATLAAEGRIAAALGGDLSEVKPDGLNPRGIVFMVPDGSPAPVPVVSEVRDPWGHLYRIRLDTNYDNQVIDPETGAAIPNSVLVWSPGPDGIEETWEDNLKTWGE